MTLSPSQAKALVKEIENFLIQKFLHWDGHVFLGNQEEPKSRLESLLLEIFKEEK